MTPTPEQNAKRVPTPRTDALLAASASFTDAEQRDILKVGLQQLETELTELRQAADGVVSAMDGCARRLIFVLSELSGDPVPKFDEPIPSALENIKAMASAKSAYRAAGEGSPKDTGTSKE